ncbi:hypothetical protein [Streptomyces viridosporus]|uniref:Uncharacterized protein n=1 Tax=Streptomyces viridosporus (strain ATCC 14672 / DSM 40746 / JCM 4963 / KCTC 9882 / NRRL B-12104 / FH 1290) TaxID=566461 RepID=D5ZPG1_STRV1|nr:hypothetical protein [Streptomyces viridosporus]EFE68217.1 conserved hypothetical protein [Streptomyces viridosporus ATCC 14672]
MKKLWWTVPVAAAGAAAVRRSRQAHRADGRAGDRWLTVTINRSAADVGSEGKLPPPLDDLAERIDVRVRPAPGDRGTELAARFKEPVPAASASLPARLAGQDPRQELRRALRDAKALLEAGEVLRPDAPPTTRPTPGGKLIELFTRRSGEEGVL